MFPIIPVVCVAGMIASAVGLTWYDSLPAEKQKQADRLASKLAQDWFSKSVENLSTHEMRVISEALERHMVA